MLEGLPHQLLLVAAFAALVFAARRAAARISEPGVERFVAGAPLVAAAAALEALLLGRVGLGGEPLALATAAFLTAAAALWLLPRPEPAGLWSALGRRDRLLWGAAAGAGLTWVAWIFRRPVIGIDGITYQLAEAVAWVHGGDTGSVIQTFYDVPTGNYPVTNEVLLSWGIGISHSLAPGLLLGPLLAVVLGASGWLGLRGLGAPRLPTGLALAALLTVPFVVRGVAQPGSDIPASAWLACCGALIVAASRRPALLAPALVAAGLAAGTKPTAVILVGVLAVVAVAMHRRRLADVRPALWVAAGVAAGVLGTAWYLRNLVDHGSPLWPFAGNDRPPLFDALSPSLLERPRATLSGRLGLYFDELGGGVLLFAGALLAPIFARRRAVLIAALVTLAALVIWAAGPVTGRPDIQELTNLPVMTVRYLLPALVAAVATLGLAAASVPRGVAAVTGLAVVVNLAAKWPFAYPIGPSLLIVALGAVLAAAIASLPIQRVALPAAGLLAAVGLAVAADGLVARHAELRANRFGELTDRLAARPEFALSKLPVATNTNPVPTLGGDRLERVVSLIPPNESCAAVERRTQRSWVILQTPPPFLRDGRPTGLPTPGAGRCLTARRPSLRVGDYRIYAPTG